MRRQGGKIRLQGEDEVREGSSGWVLSGPFYGLVCGLFYGPVYGQVYGPVYGPVYGLVYGPVYGPVCGLLYRLHKDSGFNSEGVRKRVESLYRGITHSGLCSKRSYWLLLEVDEWGQKCKAEGSEQVMSQSSLELRVV